MKSAWIGIVSLEVGLAVLSACGFNVVSAPPALAGMPRFEFR